MNALTRPNFRRVRLGSRARFLARCLGIGLNNALSLALEHAQKILMTRREDELPAFGD